MPLFEIAIYNRKVRDLVAEGRRHRDLDDGWADTHYIEVRAPSMEAARRRMEASHPTEMGYVIENIDELD